MPIGLLSETRGNKEEEEEEATKETSWFWGCGQSLPFIIKRILGIKRIFPCSFGNKRMRLLTRAYGISGRCGSVTVHEACYRLKHALRSE